MMSSFFILLLATTTCLSSAANIQRRAATQTYAPSGPQANNWKLLGCANDLYPNGRALNAGYSGTPNGGSMTISQCLSYCASQGTYLAGIEDGYQCFCGPKLDGGAALTQAAPLSASKNGDCTVACQADSTQNCGGPNRLLLFQNTQHGQPTTLAITGQNSLGCYADNVNSRLLPYVQAGSDSNLTPQKCTSACNAMGYDHSGLEYRNQCFCGHSSSVKLGSQLSSTSCESSCSGNLNAICGGAGALTVYQGTANTTASDPATVTPAGGPTYRLIGCYTDRADSQGRALQTYNSFSDNTVEKCVTTCKNYQYAGMEYGTECRCGNTLASFSKNTATCDKACPGNSIELCGGQNYAMTLYQRSTS